MIDVENEILGEVFKRLAVKFPKLNTTSEYTRVPASFPHLSIYEADNTVLSRTQDSGSMENHATLMYEANIYSNKVSAKKQECRNIAMALDEVMAGMGFTRIMMNHIPNMNDASIYRITARYTAVVSQNKTIYRR